MKILGIDEAGRGCVIGPMVFCGFLCNLEENELLVDIGARDSKALTRSAREKIDGKLRKMGCEYSIVEIHPRELDRENINKIGMDKIIELISRFNPGRVYLDVPVSGKGIDRYNSFIRNEFAGSELEVVGENKADERYPVVGAASIIAKVHRDKAIDKIKQSYEDFGSGYPSDPKTMEFLRKYYDKKGSFPEGIVRMKWKTIQNIRQKELF